MNDLARPALYDAWHDFVAVDADRRADDRQHRRAGVRERRHLRHGRATSTWCKAGDLAIFRTAGAYGATMASTYNSRALVPEVLVDGDRYAVVAERIAPETIMAAERVPEWLTVSLHSLPLFVRLAGRPVILLGEGEAADAKRRLLERAGAVIVGEDAEAALAIVAIDDEPEAQRSRGSRRAACWSTRSTGPICATSPCPRSSTARRCSSRSAPAACRRGWRRRCGSGWRRCCRRDLGELAEALHAARRVARALSRQRRAPPRDRRGAGDGRRARSAASGDRRRRRVARRRRWAPAVASARDDRALPRPTPTTSRCARRARSRRPTACSTRPTCPPRSSTARAPMRRGSFRLPRRWTPATG